MLILILDCLSEMNTDQQHTHGVQACYAVQLPFEDSMSCSSSPMPPLNQLHVSIKIDS